MPFAQRIVTPVRLSRKPVDKENQFDLDIVCNNALVSAIKQLSNLAEHADGLFSQLSQEFVSTVQKAEKLKSRVDSLAGHVSGLNAKSVKVPESDLESYAKKRGHYYSNNNYHGSLFAPETRPDCVKVLYENAEENPVRIIRQCNARRTDGRTGSKLFSLTPFFQDETFEEKDEDLQVKPRCYAKIIQCLVPPVSDADRKKKSIPEAKSRPKSMPHFPEIEVRPCSPDLSLLPTPEDKVKLLSRSQPVALVPIDITGSGFDRMCEQRESVRSTSREYLEEGSRSLRKKKRRPTVSGAPGLVFNEVSTSMYNMNRLNPSTELSTRSVSRERPKSAALESYAPKHTKAESRPFRSKERKDRKDKYDPDESNLSRSCSLRRSLKSLFKDKKAKSTNLWAEGRPRSPGPPVVDLQAPIKRSRSLPRSLKSVMQNSVSQFSNNRSASTEGRLDARSEEDVTEESASARTKSTRSSRSAKPRKLPRSASHNSNVAYSTFVDNLSRPKSMEIGPNSFVGAGNTCARLAIPVSSPMSPASSQSTASGAQDSQGTGGKHVHVHIPDKPWTKPFADVKLRASDKGTGPSKNERQSSSSGHWSASSSSVRHSLESDYPRSASSPERLSQCDKDSAVSLDIHAPEKFGTQTSQESAATCTGDGDSSTLNGDSSDNESVINVQSNVAKMSTKDWLRSVKNKKVTGIGLARSRSNASQSSTESNPGKSHINSRLTTRNLRAHDDVHQSGPKGMSRFGDDESSIYSIDQEGFYTSMHKDCGIRRSNDQLLEADEDNMSSGSTVSEDTETNSPKPKSHSNISKKFSSFLTKRATVKRKDKKVAPPPPPRVTATLDKSNSHDVSGHSNESTPPTELQKLAQLANRMAAAKAREAQTLGKNLERSTSFESDAESIYARVRLKSTINPSAIPSLCLITPTQTDDEDADMLGFSSAWKPSGPDETTYQKYTGSLKSSKSAPGTLQDSFTLVSPDISSDLSSDKSEGPVMTGSSTWPRSPKAKPAASTPKTVLLTPPDSLTIKPPNYSLFYVDDSFAFVDSRHAIPEVKTPDSVLDSRRGFESPTNNTFKDPQESSTPMTGKGRDRFVFGTPSINSVLSANASARETPNDTFTNSSRVGESSKTSDWTATWPRRKGVKFLRTMSAKSSKDDSVIDVRLKQPDMSKKSRTLPRSHKTSSSFTQGDRAHFINTATSRKVQPPRSLSLAPVDANGEPQAAHAKLVISSPVANRACFVENPYKRSVCSPVTADDLLKFWNYSSADQWYNTLPRKSRQEVKHSLSFSSAEGLKEEQLDQVEPVINKVPKSSTMFEFGTLPRSTKSEDDDSTLKRAPSKPLYPSIISMKHSLSFGSPQKKDKANVEFGKTWYDGVDASSTVVVMNPDGSAQARGPSKSGFSAFLRDHSLAHPGNRRDSSASSISTNSSSSGKKSVTFASVHRASSSSMSRTSLDATSITSSQISDLPQGSDTRSLISDDGIQVTPQKRDPPHLQQKEPPILLSTLTRTGSMGSADAPVCTCPLETIVGSDSETPSAVIELEERPKQTGTVSQPSLSTFAKPAMASEPNVKRLKVNVKPDTNNRQQKNRLSPRSKVKHSTLLSTSFVGPSIKIEPQMDKLLTDCGKEIKPMPLITTSFVGSSLKTDSPTSPSLLSDSKTGDTSSLKRFVFPSVKKPEIVLKATPVRSQASPPKTVAHARPVGAPPPPPAGQRSTEVSNGVPAKNGPAFHVVNSRPLNTHANGEVAVKGSTDNPTERTDSVKKSMPSSALGSNNTRSSSVSSPVASLNLPTSNFGSLKKSSSASPSTTSQSTSMSLKRTSSPPSSTDSQSTSQTSASLSLKRTATPPSSLSGFSSLKRNQTPTSPEATVTPGKPTPPKFMLPKLRSWNPSAIGSPASSILSRLNAGPEAKNSQAASAPHESTSQESGHGASNGDVVERSKDVNQAAGAQATQAPKNKTVPEGALPSGPETAVRASSPDRNVVELKKSPSKPVKAVNLNKSFSDCAEPEVTLRRQNCARNSLNRSTGSLHRWSTADATGSSISLAQSASNLAGGCVSSTNLNGSSWSLAKSTDSLASNSSTAERARAAKLAFLSGGDEVQAPSKGTVADRFSRSSLGLRALSSSRTSLVNISEENKPKMIERSFSTSSTSSTGSSQQLSSSEKENNNNNSRKSSTSSTSSPVQGKFVTSVLGQLQKKGMNASTTKLSQVDSIETGTK